MSYEDKPLTVGELREILAPLDADTIIVLSSDPEGNSYSPAYNADDQRNYADGEVGFRVLTPEIKADGYDHHDLLPDGVPAVVIWPLY